MKKTLTIKEQIERAFWKSKARGTQGPHWVIRMPTSWEVVDKRFDDNPYGGFRRISNHRSPEAAWRRAIKLNKQVAKDKVGK